MVTVEARAVGRNNNFNLLRMVAATAVLISHAWPMALGPDATEPLAKLTGYKLGTTAVLIFFAISGFFITKSFDQRKSVADFALARVARIYPGLLVVLLLTVLVLGPIFTALPVGRYFGDRHTWTYIFHNLALRHPQWTLPGVLVTDRGPSAINGSLWTLFYEVSCYLIVVAAGLIRLSRPLTFPIIMAGALLPFFLMDWEKSGETVTLLFLSFALGAAAHVYRRHVPVSGWLASGLAAIAALAYGSPIYPPLYALAVSYGALWFGLARIPLLDRYNLLGDYSYGMYIYAFPIGQIVAASWHPIGPLALIGVTFPIVLALAIASWSFVESPALAHRHTLAAHVRLRRMRQRL